MAPLKANLSLHAGLQNHLQAVDDLQERPEMVLSRSGKLYTSKGHSFIKDIIILLLVA